ncbi:GGDEF domain-containing protein [Rhizorhapis suberifaciens]|uniref:diguanylate cyclase n=1 Tax=Rhizorhapis suberifaciens TaxID=13656 RepID=A0A840HUY7_9SPHN|nr:GGDEF domain-containing protein [Rhizorhapis suberifaciens]MBB4641390.1 diguanylate cyclase (GGDEF)-like protein [Rhizorhapis suberifaciens]
MQSLKIENRAPSGDAERIRDLEAQLAVLRRELLSLRIANSELERVVERDTLTPLYNRRYLINAINDRLKRLGRYGTRSILVFMDVDGLKSINDTHGHCAGDYALIHIAGLLSANVRATDIVARIGGDEFALVLEELSKEEAVAKLADLQTAIAQTPCEFNCAKLTLGASFGMAVMLESDTDEALVARADADMYANKRKSRKQRAA